MRDICRTRPAPRKLSQLLWEFKGLGWAEGEGLSVKRRHTPGQIVRKLRQAEAELAAGASVPEVVKRPGISEATFHRGRNHYGGMKTPAEFGASTNFDRKIEDVRKPKELESIVTLS
jgi:hypothetical protein